MESSLIDEQDLNGGKLAKQTTLEEVQSDVNSVKSDVADVKTTADNIYAKVDTEVASIKSKTDLIGVTGDTGGSATAGSIFGKLNKIISDLATHITNWTSTRAEYIDNIRSYTVTNNTASKTGVLSAKLAYVISLLENTTYGLSALKTASSGSVIKSIQRYTTSVSTGSGGSGSKDVTINAVDMSKTKLNYLGSYCAGPYTVIANIALTSNSKVHIGVGGSTNESCSVSFEVVEYY